MEPSLAIAFRELEAEVGHFLGYGRGKHYDGFPAWDLRQQAAITACLKSGLRNFYYPDPLPGTATSYDWSFLHPWTTLTLLSGESTLDMPEDFGGAEGTIIISSPSYTEIKYCNPGMVHRAFAVSASATGMPQMAAILPVKGTGFKTGQRSQLFFFPTADADYELTLSYYINPDYLTGAHPYVYGGPEHSETVLEACKAAAELNEDDREDSHAAKFIRRLATSISIDRRMKAKTSGYNGDPSYNRRQRNITRHGVGTVTINGLEME